MSNVPKGGWNFEGFTEEFKLFGNFILSYAATAEKYCTPDGTCTNLQAAADEVRRNLNRFSDDDLVRIGLFLSLFVEMGGPMMLNVVFNELEHRGVVERVSE